MASTPFHASDLLRAVDEGDVKAAERLVPLVYDELRAIARSRMRRLPPGQTLQTTALVHEAWLKLAAGEERGWSSRAHFFGAAANAMRDVLVDQARRKATKKRGGDRERIDRAPIEGIVVEGPPCDVLDLDAALRRLYVASPQKARLVSLKFFAGLSMPEIAELLSMPLRTVEREWRFTRAWLQTELGSEDGGAAE